MAPLHDIDPTINVQNLLNAAVKRLDDLSATEARRVNEQMELRSDYEEKLRVAESKRIDAIRIVDVNAVAVANERAIAQASILAGQVATSAEMLRSLVATTASTQALQLDQLTKQLTDRISQVEKSQYENNGQSGGMEKMWGWIFGLAMAAVSVWAVFFK